MKKSEWNTGSGVFFLRTGVDVDSSCENPECGAAAAGSVLSFMFIAIVVPSSLVLVPIHLRITCLVVVATITTSCCLHGRCIVSDVIQSVWSSISVDLQLP